LDVIAAVFLDAELVLVVGLDVEVAGGVGEHHLADFPEDEAGHLAAVGVDGDAVLWRQEEEGGGEDQDEGNSLADAPARGDDHVGRVAGEAVCSEDAVVVALEVGAVNQGQPRLHDFGVEEDLEDGPLHAKRGIVQEVHHLVPDEFAGERVALPRPQRGLAP
jgi:hypothetical protein